MMKIVGLMLEKTTENDKYHFIIIQNSNRYLLTLENKECDGNYIGTANIKANPKIPFTHQPIEVKEYSDIDIESISEKEIHNDMFDFYPGKRNIPTLSVNMNKFKATKRAKNKRQVYIVYGESGLGKSYVTSFLKDLSVYETDISESLPKTIKEDVIVIGNRSRFKVDDIISKIHGEFEPILIEFKRAD